MPTPALDLIVDEAIRPRLEYLSGVIAELLDCPTSDERVMKCVASVQSQCLLALRNAAADRLYPKLKLTPPTIHDAGRPHRGVLDCRHRRAPPAGRGVGPSGRARRGKIQRNSSSGNPSIAGRFAPSCGLSDGYRMMCRLVGAAGVRFPKTATPVCVPTYTRPLTMVGVMNLLPGPKLSRPPAAWLELYSSCARFVAS